VKRLVKRLRLRRGDIVVVSDFDTCERLRRCKAELPSDIGNIPIVIAPTGIRNVSVAQLRKYLKWAEAEIAKEKEKEKGAK
jgi:hypothetical protein